MLAREADGAIDEHCVMRTRGFADQGSRHRLLGNSRKVAALWYCRDGVLAVVVACLWSSESGPEGLFRPTAMFPAAAAGTR